MPSIDELNAASAVRAADLLRSCCGSASWVTAMVSRRPFPSREQLLSSAEEIWRTLDAADWREAFHHHPRIGERQGAVPQAHRGAAWSAAEQAGMGGANDDVRQMLATVNREYEMRFGFVYIVNATGRSAIEMLALARTRLSNDAETELQIAAGEQLQITRHRLEKLLNAGHEQRSGA
jgi:2-oxo-4-hydroxy-4-carboxy-5-ureidoimidazoline decarboxylase